MNKDGNQRRQVGLEHTQNELRGLLGIGGKTTWGRAAEVLGEVEKRQLWKEQYRNFSAWVKAFAASTGKSESLIWKYCKARKAYEAAKQVQPELPPMTLTQVSAETVINAEKIHGDDAKAVAGVLVRVERGELTSRDVREMWCATRKFTGVRTSRNSKNADRSKSSYTNKESQEPINCSEYELGIFKDVEDYKAGRLDTVTLDELEEALGLADSTAVNGEVSIECCDAQVQKQEQEWQIEHELEQIHDELHELLGRGERTWVRVYELIAQVHREELYKPEHKSFSAWMKAEAAREGVAESLLWHRKSAGDFYSAWSKGKDVPPLAEGSRLSENNLNLVRKIAKVDSSRGDELMMSMVDTGLSTKELGREWRELRRKESKDAFIEGTHVKAIASRSKLSISCDDIAAFNIALKALQAVGINVDEYD